MLEKGFMQILGHEFGFQLDSCPFVFSKSVRNYNSLILVLYAICILSYIRSSLFWLIINGINKYNAYAKDIHAVKAITCESFKFGKTR